MRIAFCVLVIIAALSGFAAPARAGNVVPMSVEALADLAGQVIVGRVATVRSYWADAPRRIESEITFAEVTYLKGALATSGDTFSLVLPGGTVGETTMRIGCAPVFAVGEKWVLFLLPTYQTFPVVGMTQGAFRVVADGLGVERVFDAEAAPLAGVGADGLIRATGSQAPAASRLREAHRVSLVPQGVIASEGQAVSLADFVKQLQPILATSRDHQLEQPAGRRELVSYTAVPLRAIGHAMPEGARAPQRQRGVHVELPLREDGPPREVEP